MKLLLILLGLTASISAVHVDNTTSSSNIYRNSAGTKNMHFSSNHQHFKFSEQSTKGVCQNGWISYTGAQDKCVKVFAEKKTFVDAMEFCQNVRSGGNGNLVSIHNAFQNAQTATLAHNTDPQCNYWIGLSDADGSGNYTWADSSKVDYTFWKSGQPVTSDGMSMAYLSLSDNNHWVSSSDVFGKNCFVCVQDTSTCKMDWLQFGTNCYYCNGKPESYQYNAQKGCSSLNSDLVSILSQEEQDFLQLHFDKYTPFWIGLEKETEKWVWADGSTYNYTNWKPTEPTPGYYCVLNNYSDKYGVFGWATAPCDNSYSRYSVCRYTL